MEDQGIILRRMPYSETSCILSWLTEQHGLIRTLAKGAAKPKQAFYGKTDIFLQGRVCWIPSSHSQLHVLKEISIEHANRELTQSYASLLTATYFGEIIELLAESQTPIPDIYDLFGKALGYLQEKPASNLLVERFERKLLGILGLNHGEKSIGQLRCHAYPRQPKTYHRLMKELDKF
jgi:DNA repair protein RecO (recombination protein O)